MLNNLDIELKVSINKNVQFPSKPVEVLDPPTAKAKITIGSGEGGRQGMNFALYAPQMQRVLKTLEMISAFNQFTSDVINVLNQKTFS